MCVCVCVCVCLCVCVLDCVSPRAVQHFSFKIFHIGTSLIVWCPSLFMSCYCGGVCHYLPSSTGFQVYVSICHKFYLLLKVWVWSLGNLWTLWLCVFQSLSFLSFIAIHTLYLPVMLLFPSVLGVNDAVLPGISWSDEHEYSLINHLGPCSLSLSPETFSPVLLSGHGLCAYRSEKTLCEDRSISRSLEVSWPRREAHMSLWVLLTISQSAGLLDQRQMMNHPKISSFLSEQDEDLLGYMVNLQVITWDVAWGSWAWSGEGAGAGGDSFASRHAALFVLGLPHKDDILWIVPGSDRWGQ